MNPDAPRWYDPSSAGIRRLNPNGTYTGIAVTMRSTPRPGRRSHPVPDMRGRAHAGHRTRSRRQPHPNTPLNIDILANVCLPLTVNEVAPWHKHEPSTIIEALVEGIFVVSPVDMVKCWPNIWPNRKAARRTLDATNLCASTEGQSP